MTSFAPQPIDFAHKAAATPLGWGTPSTTSPLTSPPLSSRGSDASSSDGEDTSRLPGHHAGPRVGYHPFGVVGRLLLGECCTAAPEGGEDIICEPKSQMWSTQALGGERMVEYEFYNLERLGLLGCGSFGSVTLVKCHTTGQTLALKALSKGRLLRKKLEDKVMNEKLVMQQVNSPFVIKLAACFNRDQHLYFLMEAALGGDLRTVYGRNEAFYGSEPHARFYVACMATGLDHLHEQQILYRDLKLENVVLDARGYGKLCDFGLAAVQPSLTRARTVCGTPEYMAPEVVTTSGYTFAADWWSLGIVAYEMLKGRTPFRAQKMQDIFLKAKVGVDAIKFPLRSDWPELVRGLCKGDPAKRLPTLNGGIQNIRELAWFRKAGFDWEAHGRCRMEAPYIPTLTSPADMRNFDACEEDVPRDVPYLDPGNGWDLDFEDAVGPICSCQREEVEDISL